MTSATVYLRQSQIPKDKKDDDEDENRDAVDRQLSACEELCAARGWTVDQVLTDNDISATTGKVRPGFETLLASNPRRIVVWHVDRLVRLSRDLERVIQLGVNVHAVKSGHIDLSNPAGRAVAKTITAWSQYEGEQKATRQIAANRQRAQRGQVLWSRRPFGFDRRKREVFIVDAEAQEIRDAVKKVLDGATLASIVADLNERSMPTTTGSRWTVTALKRTLLSPRVAGRVSYLGEDMGMSDLAILDADTADRLSALLNDPRRKYAPSTTTKYLLSGLVLCGRETCADAPMFATTNGRDRAPVYRCKRCYGARRRDLVDELVTAAVVARLSRPDAVELLHEGVDVAGLRDQVVELRDRRDGLAAMLADGLLTPSVVRVQAQRLTEQIQALERQIEAATGTSPLTTVISSSDVAAALEALPLLKWREVIRTLVEVRIMPAGKGVRFTPEQVRLEWKGEA